MRRAVASQASSRFLGRITLTRPSTTSVEPVRGEVWRIRFDPTQGAEMGKTRPAVVVNPPSVGRLPLRIVVPASHTFRKSATRAATDKCRAAQKASSRSPSTCYMTT
ncbi:MAG: type II toxin-antitoxin system PemK/MazF family toxin [bacterium]|nr:type II toxin-antitoxin system PemK/MazF family toxin [bacterium]